MVDDMKKQMRRFEHIIGFKGRLDVTSRDSMKRLIAALDSRYKDDIQNSIRLHRLEFFHDLVEGGRKKKQKMDKMAEASVKKKRKRKKSDEKEEEDKQEEAPEAPIETDQTESDETLSIRATDVDDWKDLMTLSKIYYVLEHPRSEGLKWRRRIAKKKKIEKFTDKDFIEWRVTQNFRLRGLEEWAQSRSDARKLAAKQNFDMDEMVSDDDVKELEQLYEMFDPSGRKYKSKDRSEKRKKLLSTAERPFKLKDETIEDWTESYSDDSDYSEEDFAEETDDFKEESDRKIPEREGTKDLAPEEIGDIAELFSKYPEFIPYTEEIFKRMEKAETTEEWFKLYFESCPTLDELEISQKEAPLITITEDEEESKSEKDEEESKPEKDEEESKPEKDEEGLKAEKLDKIEETGEEAKTESEIKEKEPIEEGLKQDEIDIVSEIKEPEPESVVKSMIQALIEETIELRGPFEVKMGSAEEEMDPGRKHVIDRIPIPEQETSRQKEKKQPEAKSKSEKVIHFPEEDTVEEKEQLESQTDIVKEGTQPETKSATEKVISIPEEETVGKSEQLDSEKEKRTETESAVEEVIKIPEDEATGETEQAETQKGINDEEKKYENGKNGWEITQIQEEETIDQKEKTDIEDKAVEKIEPPLESTSEEETTGKSKQLDSEKEKRTETESAIEGVIKIPKDEATGETEQAETQKEIDDEEKKYENGKNGRETTQMPKEETIELKEKTDMENEAGEKIEPPLESTSEEEAKMLTEPRQKLDSEIKKNEDEKDPKIEAAAEADESDSIKDARTEEHEDIEKNEEVAESRKSKSSFKGLEQTHDKDNTSDEAEDSLEQGTTSTTKEQNEEMGKQKSGDTENEVTDTDEGPVTRESRKSKSSFKGLEQTQDKDNTSDEAEDSFEQGTTPATKEQNEEMGMQKSVDTENEVTDTDEGPVTETSELDTDELSAESGKQDNNGNKLDAVKKESGGKAKRRSSKYRRKSRRSIKYSLIPVDDYSTVPSFTVQTSGSLESVLLCEDCSRSITGISSLDVYEDETSETDSNTEEEAKGKKDTESD